MATLTQVLASLASFIFYASLKTTVLVALILLAQKLLGRFLSANGRYLLWLTVVISLVTPIGFDTTLPAFVTPANGFAPITQPVNETTGRLVAATPGTGVTGSALNPDSSPPATYVADAASAPSIPWGALMPWLWLTGALLVLGLVAFV
jgi:beta-lactamase regulating signal transducer with metallopeptidase domain